MTIAALNALAPSVIAAFTSADVQALSTTQINGLSAANLQAVNTASLTAAQVAGLAAATLANLKPAQLSALPAADLAALTKAQEQALTATQIAGLSATAFDALNLANLAPSQVAAITSTEIASLSTANFDKLALASVSAPAFAGLTVADAQSLTTTEIAGLSTAQLNAMSAADLAGLSATQDHALTSAQISGMSVGAFDALNLANLASSQVAAITSTEIASLSAANFDKLALASVSASAFAGVSVAELESLTLAQINGLSAPQTAALSAANAAYVSDFKGVYVELAKVESGGALSFSGAETLLQAEASGGDTAGKFTALSDIARSLNASGGPTASAMVAQLFDDVVLGNADNATWTGGAATSTTLGNLSASSSQTQLTELIDKWFLGSDNPSATIYGSTYQSQTGALFSGTPTYQQVNQGGVGDCYFESAMAATADFDPTLIENMITSDGNGVYTVDFYNGASDPHDYVTVNAQMPVMSGGYAYASGSDLTYDNGGASGAIWSEVMEKAYVEFRAQGGEANAYSAISGGNDNGLEAITGQAIQDYQPQGDTAAQLQQLLTTCSQAMSSHDAVMMNDVSANSALHLVGDHMYNVLSVNVAAGTVTIDNPWNANGFAGGAGETFTDSLSALASAGVTFHVATGTARAA